MAYQAEPYRASGSMGTGFLLPIVGLLSAALSALIYAYITVYSPIAGYISILFVAGLAAGAVLPLAFAARLLKCRNSAVLWSSGLITGVAAIYLAWALFLQVLIARETGDELVPGKLEMIQNPEMVWTIMKALGEEGWYSIASWTPSGFVLWAFWAIEAAIVVLGCVLLSGFFVKGQAYCEDCGAWCDDNDDILVPVTNGSMVEALKQDGPAGLTEVPPRDTETNRWLRLHSQTCMRCGSALVWGVEEILVQVDDKGEPDTTTTALIPLSLMDDSVQAEIQRINTALDSASLDRAQAGLEEAEGKAESAG